MKCYNQIRKSANFKQEEYEEENNFFNKHIYFFTYEGTIRKIILDFKFNEKVYLVNTIYELLIKEKKIFEILKNYDTIIPVPISKKRLKQRGFNQSELIAKKLLKIVGNLSLEKNALRKTKDIIEQSKLNKEDRMENIKGVYEVTQPEKIRNKSILLIDDIFTTGSTVRECSKILKLAGAKEVTVMTIAKD